MAQDSKSTPASDLLLAIFDHDGVLVDTLAFHQQAWVDMGKETGLDLTEEFIHKTFGMTNASIFQLLKGDSITADEMKSYSDLKEDRYRNAATGNIALMEGVRELLDGLIAHGVRLAIGSSGVLPNLQLTVRECGLDGQFAAIASVEDITKGKPDPQVFLVAARKCGIDPARSMVFEDAPVGIQAAKSAGMYAVGLTTSHPAQAMWDAGADEVVEDLRGYNVAALVQRVRERATAMAAPG